MGEQQDTDKTAGGEIERREFFPSAAMAAGLAAGYGTLATMAGRYLYLYPGGARNKAWLFVTDLKGMKRGGSMVYEAPTGAKVVIARRAENGNAEDFVALSSVCPHLGCQVHWEPQNNRFFCPCHNGVFDPAGKAIEGPPAAAKQSLVAYPLKVEGGLLFIETAVVGLGSPEEV